MKLAPYKNSIHMLYSMYSMHAFTCGVISPVDGSVS